MTSLEYQSRRNRRGRVLLPAFLFALASLSLTSAAWAGHRWHALLRAPNPTVHFCGVGLNERMAHEQRIERHFAFTISASAACAISTLCAIRFYNSCH